MKLVEVSGGVAENNFGVSRPGFPGLNDVEAILKDILMGAEGTIKDMCVSLLDSGGKRIRPMMVIYSGLCFSKLNMEVIHTAAAAELIHMASLVHDDVIDKAETRRGRATINSTHGNHAAVLAGDYIFAKAFAILSSFKLLKSMEYLVEAIQEMCDGEVSQESNSFNTSLTVDDYFKKIGKKTAVLVSSCCRAGAAAANAGDMEVNIMHEYGMNVGYAFQIIDDILDFTGDESKTGKPKGLDLMQGNITLPVILLMKDERYGPWVRRLLDKKSINREEFLYVSEILDKTQYIKKSLDIARTCVAKAKSSIYGIPESPFRKVLLDMADKTINRDH